MLTQASVVAYLRRRLGPRGAPRPQVGAMANPVRREFHLLKLLSGCRPEAQKSTSLSDLHLADRSLHRRAPKGGERPRVRRAAHLFEVGEPLEVIDLLDL